jgi:iron-sulfur cluster assembly enzyme ISCU, mitochondrial
MLSRVAQTASRSVRLTSPLASQIGGRRGYHETIVEHYENPRNVGSLDKNDPSVGTVSACLSAE